MLHRRFNLRAGMVLVPVGIINERHEPPTFHGVERTFVDTVIVPTTWRDTGVGAFGDLGPRLFVSRLRRAGPRCDRVSPPKKASRTDASRAATPMPAIRR